MDAMLAGRRPDRIGGIVFDPPCRARIIPGYMVWRFPPAGATGSAAGG